METKDCPAPFMPQATLLTPSVLVDVPQPVWLARWKVSSTAFALVVAAGAALLDLTEELTVEVEVATGWAALVLVAPAFATAFFPIGAIRGASPVIGRSTSVT